ncbi:MAG: hypothetical protein JNM18_21485 [Planctomycetaceae bacterium]|nr:hypothetical protein [Planctomycetaceae bacterium]
MSTSLPTSAAVSWSDELANRVAAQRFAVQQRAQRQREQLAQFQARRQAAATAPTTTVDASRELAELIELEQELEQHRQQLGEQEQRLKQQQADLERREQQLAEDAADLARKRERCEDRAANLESEYEAIETEKTRTMLQRKRIAEQFREERRARGVSVEVDQLKVQLRQLTEERDTLNELLNDAQQQLQDQPVVIGGSAIESADAEELTNLQGKYDMAMTDLRELRRRNAELETRIAQSVQASPGTSAMDWESQKKRMLAALEAEERNEKIAPDRADDRLTIEGTIQITDQMIADKDHEIAELKRLLEEQSQNVGSMAVGAAAIGAMLESDDIVQQERERLLLLESEMTDKLRQAEIDISRERAKLARDRVEIDELRRQLEIERSRAVPTTDPGGRKTPGGNWLARLGLKGEE